MGKLRKAICNAHILGGRGAPVNTVTSSNIDRNGVPIGIGNKTKNTNIIMSKYQDSARKRK